MSLCKDIEFALAIPIGPSEKHVKKTLLSLEHQCPTPHLAILDASGETSITEETALFSDLVVYQRCGSDNGQAAAIAEGWDKLKGNVLGWLNADDYLLPGALARVAKAFAADPDLDVVYGQSIFLNFHGEIIGYHPSVHPISALVRRACVISQPSCFVRRCAIEAIGGINPSLNYMMDWDLWQRLFENGAKFEMLDQTLSAVTISKGTKTGNLSFARLQEARLLTAKMGWFISLKSLYGFTAHHFMSYVFGKRIRRIAKFIWPSRGKTVAGLTPDGIINHIAHLPVSIFEPSPKKTLSVTIEGKQSSRAQLRLLNDSNQVLAEAQCKNGLTLLTTSTQKLCPGEPLMLQIETQEPIRFIKASWS